MLDALPNGLKWIDTATAAALLGVTERAIQKRAQSGKIRARRVEGKRGPVWEIEAENVQNQARTRANNKPEQAEPDAEQLKPNKPNRSGSIGDTPSNHAHISPNTENEEDEQNTERDAEQAEPETAAKIAKLRAELEATRAEVGRERELNGFFRAQIEEGNRNAAELRAALREALKAQPRQLTSGTPQASSVQASDILQTKASAKPHAEIIATTENDDVLSDEEINELCQSFFRMSQ